MIVCLMIFSVQNIKSYPHSPAPSLNSFSVSRFARDRKPPQDGMPVFRASAETTILVDITCKSSICRDVVCLSTPGDRIIIPLGVMCLGTEGCIRLVTYMWFVGRCRLVHTLKCSHCISYISRRNCEVCRCVCGVKRHDAGSEQDI
jgi:hypothetical protein